MMIRVRISLCSRVVLQLVSAMLIVSRTWAGTAGVPLRNPGFENAAPGGIPLEWNRVGPPLTPGNEAHLDSGVSHSGGRSFVFRHRVPGSSTLSSAPIKLEIGRLYRLSGWVRTEDAISDPTSRYPTAVAATMSMESFPFTNESPSAGATNDWKKVEVLFLATQKEDRVRIHFGFNGTATGAAWFDDLAVEEVDDITAYIPPETVRWFGPSFRYTDRGWTFVHIEGEPYQRGYQYGYLLAKEIGVYLEKLATRGNPDDPRRSWNEMRTLTDALMLRKYDTEYLDEMKGIADGAAKGGAAFGGKPLDLLDVVTLNSAVDIGQLGGALAKTSNAASGRSFKQEEDEMNAAERLHKCSSFLANGPATKDGKIVFAQLFMWNGYTGVHWDVICDVVPARGQRFVYETFPGGIHSGADFYINQAGIMIGETTVMQTPFNADGTPQSCRIRRAAQYAGSIDDVVRILTEKNNGLYTNDWLIADSKTNENAILLLGTTKWKLWRSRSGEFPGGTTGFYWSVNNAKDPEVRKEYISDPSNAPMDIVFGPVNRDVSFVEYYRKEKGKIDAISAINEVATSPITRPHACDGKVTTGDMAERMVFLAHFGKVTLREKFPEKNGRLIPDLPGAIPHFSLGYTVFSPIYVTEKLKALKARHELSGQTPTDNFTDVSDLYSFDRRLLWMNTVYPSSEADNWFVSGTAAYWNLLNNLPPKMSTARVYMEDQFKDMACRLQYVTTREGSVAPVKATRQYDRLGSYQIPRIRGTFLLHQLRLLLGNEPFSSVMNAVHNSFRDRPMSTEQFVEKAEEVSKKDLREFIMQWLDRDDWPAPQVQAGVSAAPGGWDVSLTVTQSGRPYAIFTTVAIETEKETRREIVHVTGSKESFTFSVPARPVRLTFNAGSDIPVQRKDFYTFSNYFDDYHNSVFVYGTARQIEANHTIAARFQTVLADAFTDIIPPLIKESEATARDIDSTDMILLGEAADNPLCAAVAKGCGVELGKNFFRWQGRLYGEADDGIFLAYPNHRNSKRIVYLFIGNSALEEYQMTKRFQGLPSWAIFKRDQVVEKGYHPVEGFVIPLGESQAQVRTAR